MRTEPTVEARIDEAAKTVGPVWPIHSFVTANPLSGFEELPFGEAVTQAADLLGGRGYPSRETFRAALEEGRIDRRPLRGALAARGFDDNPRRCPTAWTPRSNPSRRRRPPRGSTTR